MTTEQIRQLLIGSPELRAFLRVIREGESCQEPDAYWWLFGSTRSAPRLAEQLDDHPRVRTYERYDGQFIKNGKIDFTTAAGAYQITASTWDTVVQPGLKLPDFRPASQDIAAVFLIAYRRALAAVLEGRPRDAMALLRDEWASMPGAAAGDQPTQRLDAALRVSDHWLAVERAEQPAAATPAAPDPPPSMPAGEAPDWPPPAPPPTPQEPSAMAPILAGIGKSIVVNALPSIVQAIPRLGSIFGPGSSEVAQRNVKALEVVADTISQAVGAANAQQAVEALQDPAKAAAARAAVDQRWAEIGDLVEAGGGGIDGARKGDAATRAAGDFLRSPSFWVAVLLLPLVYLLVLSLIGLVGSATWSDDVRAGLAGSLISAVVGGLVGYYYGQTTNRTPQP